MIQAYKILNKNSLNLINKSFEGHNTFSIVSCYLFN